jgi:hypothetical protein
VQRILQFLCCVILLGLPLSAAAGSVRSQLVEMLKADTGEDLRSKPLRNAMEIAIERDIIGKSQGFQCGPFSVELFKRFTLNQTPAWVIQYHWDNAYGIGARNRSYNHAIVVFRPSPSDSFYATDNMLVRPIHVRGTNPTEWLSSFRAQLHPSDTAALYRVDSNEFAKSSGKIQ